MAKSKNTKPAVESPRSISELTGIIASKDQALEVKDQIIAENNELILDLAEQVSDLKSALVAAEKTPAVAPVAAGLPVTGDLDELERAVEVLKANDFMVLTDARIQDGRTEDGNRARSFRYRGRYEVAIVRGRKGV